MRPVDQVIRSFQVRSDQDLADLDRATTEVAIARDTRSAHLVDEFTQLRRLWVGNGDARTMERVAGLSSLEVLVLVACRGELPNGFQLPNLRTLLLLDSAEVTCLDPLATLTHVEILGVAGCSQLHDYSPLGSLRGLKQLEIGSSRHYQKASAASLSFLAPLQDLEHLAVFFASIADGSIDAIADLQQLRTLEISSTFSRESMARLAAKLSATSCEWFKGWQSLGTCPKCNTESLVMLTGKGQRNLCRTCQSERFATKIEEWQDLLRR